jgi:hypothetical protein
MTSRQAKFDQAMIDFAEQHDITIAEAMNVLGTALFYDKLKRAGPKISLEFLRRKGCGC